MIGTKCEDSIRQSWAPTHSRTKMKTHCSFPKNLQWNAPYWVSKVMGRMILSFAVWKYQYPKGKLCYYCVDSKGPECQCTTFAHFSWLKCHKKTSTIYIYMGGFNWITLERLGLQNLFFKWEHAFQLAQMRCRLNICEQDRNNSGRIALLSWATMLCTIWYTRFFWHYNIISYFKQEF